MQNVPELSPVLQYGPVPLIIAIAGLVLVVGWYGLVFWLTRRKPQKVLASLPPASPTVVDTSKLKAEYLQRIDTIEAAYRSRELRARVVHQQLSTLVRRFVSEAVHVPAHTMTLADLKKTKFEALVPVIGSYYQPEFSAVETGNVDSALAAARKVVTEWS